MILIDTTELYILILVYVILTLNQALGIQESKNFCASYLPKLQMDLDGKLHAVETCWFGESYIHLIYSKEIYLR